jgi:hypothetical protein
MKSKLNIIFVLFLVVCFGFACKFLQGGASISEKTEPKEAYSIALENLKKVNRFHLSIVEKNSDKSVNTSTHLSTRGEIDYISPNKFKSENGWSKKNSNLDGTKYEGDEKVFISNRITIENTEYFAIREGQGGKLSPFTQETSKSPNDFWKQLETVSIPNKTGFIKDADTKDLKFLDKGTEKGKEVLMYMGGDIVISIFSSSGLPSKIIKKTTNDKGACTIEYEFDYDQTTTIEPPQTDPK